VSQQNVTEEQLIFLKVDAYTFGFSSIIKTACSQ